MRVRVLLFASARQRAGRGEVELSLPPGARASAVLESPVLAALRADRSSLRVAVNEEFSDWDAALSDGDVLALLPPMSGG